jgi:hypothetical protein
MLGVSFSGGRFAASFLSYRHIVSTAPGSSGARELIVNSCVHPRNLSTQTSRLHLQSRPNPVIMILHPPSRRRASHPCHPWSRSSPAEPESLFVFSAFLRGESSPSRRRASHPCPSVSSVVNILPRRSRVPFRGRPPTTPPPPRPPPAHPSASASTPGTARAPHPHHALPDHSADPYRALP